MASLRPWTILFGLAGWLSTGACSVYTEDLLNSATGAGGTGTGTGSVAGGGGAGAQGAANPGGSDAGPIVWINEIHYDNVGPDVDEGVELAGPAATDLAGWSIYFYNPSTDTWLPVASLTGVLPDTQAGYGVLWVAYDGMQNDDEAIALVNGQGQVIQFLSYEGTYTAQSGPAVGMTSTDIGVAELTDTPVNYSLQLQGVGKSYGSMYWTGPLSHSRDAINHGQSFTP